MNKIITLTPLQESFPNPDEDSLKSFKRDSCINIAKQICTNSYSDDEYGNFSRECAVLILNSLAENMSENESLAEYFGRKKEI